MSLNVGTLITAAIRPNDSLDLIASAFANEIKGGHHGYASLVERNSLITERREWGMLVTVYNDGANNGTYQLTYNYVDTVITNNANWTIFAGGGGGGSVEWVDSVFSLLGVDPGTASVGDRYLISSPSGNWATYPNHIAEWITSATWSYTIPRNGLSVRVDNQDDSIFRYEGSYPSGTWIKELVSQVRFVSAISVTGVTYSASTNPTFSYSTEMLYLTTFGMTNSASASLNINGMGNIPIKKIGISGLSDVSAGDLTPGVIYNLTYDGSRFQLILPVSTIFGNTTTIAFTYSGSTVSSYVISGSLTASHLNTATGMGPTAGYILSVGSNGVFNWIPSSSITGITAGFGLTGGGNSGIISLDVRATNGLIVGTSSDSVELGGTLTKNTNITGTGSFSIGLGTTADKLFNLTSNVVNNISLISITGSGPTLVNSNLQLNKVNSSLNYVNATTSRAGGTIINSTGHTSQFNDGGTNYVDSILTSTSSITRLYDFNFDENSFQMHYDPIPVGDGSTNNRFVVTDFFGEKGLVYAGSYSANFTTYSLITKEYVDVLVAGLSFSGATGSSTNNKYYIGASETIIVPTYSQYWIYGNLTIAGQLTNYGQVVIADGSMIMSGGTFSNFGSLMFVTVGSASGTSSMTSYMNSSTIGYTVIGYTVSSYVIPGSLTSSHLNTTTGMGPTAGYILSVNNSGIFQWVPGSGTGTITGVTAGAGLTGGGVSGAVTIDVNTNNGIEIVNDYVGVGGSLVRGTTISTGVYNMDFYGTTGTIKIETGSGLTPSLMEVSSLAARIQSGDPIAPVKIELFTTDQILGTGDGSSNNRMIITDYSGNNKGIVYADDYTAQFTTHSLVTKGYVVSQKSVMTVNDKSIISLETTADGQWSGATISGTPVDNCYVSVYVNGMEFVTGNGVTNSVDCYFSVDGGANARGFSSAHPNGKVQVNDRLYWNGSVAGVNLLDGWRISIHYLI